MSGMRRSMLIASRMCVINVIAANTSLIDAEVIEGDSYSTQIVCDEGYSIYEITIKMGGVDITSTAYDPTYNMINIASVTDDVDIVCYAMHSIPSNYVRVDGIKNPSNACLNTSHAVNSNNRLELKYKVVKAASGYTHIAASKDPGMSTTNGSGWYIHTNGNIYCYTNTSAIDTGPDAVTSLGKTLEYVADYYKKTHIAVRDGVSTVKALQTKNTTDNYALYLFSRFQGTAASQSAGQIIYYFHIYDYSTTSYVRYYIPCLNASGVAGFWDAARGVFQGSSNSTAFEACYTQRGLVFQLDGINKGTTADAWTDLVGGIVFNKNGNVTSISDGWNFPRGNVNDTLTSSENPHNFNGAPYTIEVCFKTTISGTTSQILIQMPQSKSLVFAQSGAGPFTFRQGYNRYSATLKKGVRRTVSLNNNIGIAEGNELTKTASDAWATSFSYIKIGSGDSTYSFVGDIYAIRIYNVNLTKDEILLNQRMDNKRFNLGLTI